MAESPSDRPVPAKAHIVRLLIAIGVALVVIYGGQYLLQPSDWGEIGPYTTSGLREVLAREPVHLGKEACAACHAEIHGLHSKDVHFNVECEDCHEPGRKHVEFHLGSGPVGDAEAARLPKEYTREGCLFCHRRLAARPRTFAQVDPEEHYAFLGVNDPEVKCIACHSPHEPLFVLERVTESRLHPMIQECTHCHDEKPEGDFRETPDHPTIFVCQDCHPKVVEDFVERTHSFMRCTACHLFHFENDNAGRILKNGNRRFCLLCHRDEPFRAGAPQPLVDPTAHLGEMAETMGMDVADLEKDTRACLKCHRRLIHGNVGRR